MMNSVRNSSLLVSVNRNCFCTLRSKVLRPGPRTVPTPQLPKPEALTEVPDSLPPACPEASAVDHKRVDVGPPSSPDEAVGEDADVAAIRLKRPQLRRQAPLLQREGAHSRLRRRNGGCRSREDGGGKEIAAVSAGGGSPHGFRYRRVFASPYGQYEGTAPHDLADRLVAYGSSWLSGDRRANRCWLVCVV